MSIEDHPDVSEIDEGSWIYLSAGPADPALLDELTAACARSGWRAISHPPAEREGRRADPGLFFASVSHAVEHADVVVAVIGAEDEMSDAELTLAYSHGRPVVGVKVGVQESSETSYRLDEYERARVVACNTPGECRTVLHETLSDPSFAETIRRAA